MCFPELEALAHRLADAAAAVTVPLFRTNLAADNKDQSAFDPVTEADRAAETAIRDILIHEHPEHGIYGEEFGVTEGASRYEWVIDPIDGTRSFMAGIPLWTTIIGLRVDGVPRLGLVDQPYIGDRFWGWGETARFRGPRAEGRLHVRPCADLAEATLMTTSPALMQQPGERMRYDSIERQVRLARYGADGYAYCLLAGGHIDLVVEASLEPYDVVGLVPIIEAAGGIVTDWAGGPADRGTAIVAAGDRRVHAAARGLLEATADGDPGGR